MKTVSMFIVLLLAACGAPDEVEDFVPCSPRMVFEKASGIALSYEQALQMTIAECGGSVKAVSIADAYGFGVVNVYCGTKGYENTDVEQAVAEFQRTFPARMATECCPSDTPDWAANHCLKCFEYEVSIGNLTEAITTCGNR